MKYMFQIQDSKDNILKGIDGELQNHGVVLYASVDLEKDICSLAIVDMLWADSTKTNPIKFKRFSEIIESLVSFKNKCESMKKDYVYENRRKTETEKRGKS